MKITLSPQRGLPGQPETTVTVTGDTITVDGTAYDLSAVPEGGEATPQGEGHPFVGPITRRDGVIHAALRVVLGDDAARAQPADPALWHADVTSGPVTIPAIRKEDVDA